MSTRLWSRPRNQSRQAPPGVRPPRLDSFGPPDGWLVVTPKPGQRFSSWIDSGIIYAADGMARLIPRREFLKRAGEAGVATGLALSGVLWSAGPIHADEPDCGPCNCQVSGNDENPNACGPSPPCNASQCLSGGRCNLNASGVRRRVNPSTSHWSGLSCGQATDHHCWLECCPAGGSNKKFRCCDCCVDSCAACTTSCNGCTMKKRCVCENNTQTAC